MGNNKNNDMESIDNLKNSYMGNKGMMNSGKDNMKSNCRDNNNQIDKLDNNSNNTKEDSPKSNRISINMELCK